jgi:hypothetical protein
MLNFCRNDTTIIFKEDQVQYLVICHCHNPILGYSLKFNFFKIK